MLSLIRKISEKPVIRSVNLYFAPDNAIVAAVHQNLAGIRYEQPQAASFGKAPATAELGAAFSRAFAAFSVRDADLRDFRKSDWPAFRASALRSVKEFERLYLPVLCQSLNSSNALVRASVAHPRHAGIELSATFNPGLPPDIIGEQLLRLVEAAKGAG